MAPVEITEDRTVPLHFMGLLANTDASIMGVGLEHDLIIGSMSEPGMGDHLASIENLQHPDPQWRLLWDHCCTNREERMCYFVQGTIESEDERHSTILRNIRSFDHSVIDSYLEPTLSLMRLFGKGNLCLPLRYYYTLDEKGTACSCGWLGERRPVAREPYTLDPTEVRELEGFVKRNIRKPMMPFVKMAVELFDHSFLPGPRGISLSLLLNAMGTLLGTADRGENGFDFTRNLAILLGESRRRAENIHRDAGELVEKGLLQMRKGVPGTITRLDVVKARAYTRESIKEVLELDLGKRELMRLLGGCGYGERPWKTGRGQ